MFGCSYGLWTSNWLGREWENSTQWEGLLQTNQFCPAAWLHNVMLGNALVVDQLDCFLYDSCTFFFQYLMNDIQGPVFFVLVWAIQGKLSICFYPYRVQEAILYVLSFFFLIASLLFSPSAVFWEEFCILGGFEWGVGVYNSLRFLS